MLKRNRKIIRNIIILILLVFTMYLYITSKYTYIVGSNLLEQSYIVYGGDVDIKDQPIIKVQSNQHIIPILKDKEVQISNIKNETQVYEVIKVDGLEPFKQYDINFEFTIEGLEEKQSITVGYQDQRINTIEDASENQKVANIDLTNSKTFIKAEDDYISVPLTITANEEGNGYFYIGMDVTDKDTISYNLLNVRIRK